MNEFFTRLYSKSFEEFVTLLEERLEKTQKTFVITANPETFMIASKDQEMKEMILDPTSFVVPDGVGIVKASRMLGMDIKERITGIDLAWKLLELGNLKGKSIYLFGSSEEVVQLMVQKVTISYPHLKIVGYQNGYIKNKEKEMEKILKKQPDIVMVALGIPAQEKLIYRHLKKFKKGIFIGVGGSFDVISGSKKRAPKVFLKLNLEWLYRLLKEPRRWKRFYQNNVKFILKVRRLKKNDKSNDSIWNKTRSD